MCVCVSESLLIGEMANSANILCGIRYSGAAIRQAQFNENDFKRFTNSVAVCNIVRIE